MLQSKWVRIPFKIFLIFMVVTLYFYFQQPVIYRCQNLNVNLPVGEGQLLLHEINVTNQDESQAMRALHDWEDKQKIPWRVGLYQKMAEMGLPMSWSVTVLKIASFYSWPPLAEDSYYLYIDGVFIDAEEASFEERPSALERFSVYTYPGGTSNGTGSMREFFRNADMISAYGRIDPRQLDQPLIITIVDNETTRSTKFILTPDWKKERLLERARHYQSPADPVRNFLYQVYAEHPQEALKNVLSQRRNNIPLPKPAPGLQAQNIQMEGLLTWVDVYEGYFNVYQVDTEIGIFSEDDDFKPQDKLSFYTVRDPEGNFKIIGWK